MILYLIRHGESVYNAQGRIQGQTDIALSELGRKQANAVATAFTGIELDAVIASPLQRAWETARPLAERHNLIPQACDGLKEIHAGIFAGLRWDEIEERYPQYATPWREQRADFVIPEGESRAQLQTRGEGALRAIRELPYEHVAVVAHGGILTAALKGLLGIGAELNPFSLFNASISRVIWNSRFQLLTLNQVEHLRLAELDREENLGNL